LLFCLRDAAGVLKDGRSSFPLKKILNVQGLREKDLDLTERVVGPVHTEPGLEVSGFFIRIKTKCVI